MLIFKNKKGWKPTPKFIIQILIFLLAAIIIISVFLKIKGQI